MSPPGDETTAAAGNATDTTTGPVTTQEPAPSVSESYAFTEGESYAYAVTTDSSTFRMGWAVESVDERNVSVNVTATTEGGTGAMPFRVERSQAFDQAFRTDSLGPMFFVLRLPIRAAANRSLTEGNEWTVERDALAPEATNSLDWETATVTVGGQSTVGDYECREVTIDPESTDAAVSACIAEDWPFALSVTDGDGDGTRLVVVDATRP